MAGTLTRIVIAVTCLEIVSAITMQQFEQSLDLLRNGCMPKFKVNVEVLDKMRNGQFTDDSKDTKCYTRCIAQLGGTLTKRGDFSVQKAQAQIPIILPEEMHKTALASLDSCKDVQKNYSDSCDRIYYLTKCIADYDPKAFKFP